MYLRSLLLSASLLCLIHGGRAEPTYVFITPLIMRSGLSEIFCTNLNNHKVTLQLNAVLQYNGANTTIFDIEVPPSDFYMCNEITVPRSEADVPVDILFSAVGEGVKHLKRTVVMIATVKNIYQVQLQKPFFRPGETARWNVISLTPELKPLNATFSKITLQAPNGNIIAEWLNVMTQHGILQMEFYLIKDIAEGYYSLIIQGDSDNSLYQGFSVQNIVLPRYKVTLDLPSTASVLDTSMNITVNVEYSYGEPVPGTVTVKCCRLPMYSYGRRANCMTNKNGICNVLTGRLDSDGSYHEVIDLEYFHMQLGGFQSNLNFDITVTEDGSGEQAREYGYVWITSQLATLSYEEHKEYYRWGIPYRFKTYLRDEQGHPMPNEEVQVDIDGMPSQKVITDSDGKAELEIDTCNIISPNFTITASYLNPNQCYDPQWQDGRDYPYIQIIVQRYYSISGSFVELENPTETLKCGEVHKIKAQYKLSEEGTGGSPTAKFFFQVISQSVIVQAGMQEVDLSESMKGSFFFEIFINYSVSYNNYILIYNILSNEVIADVIYLNTESCFKNQVSLEFSEAQGAPGSEVELQVSAAPGSLCALRVVDERVDALYPYNKLNPYQFTSSLSTYFYGYTAGSLNLEESAPPCEDPNKQIFCKGKYYTQVSSWREADTYSLVKGISLFLHTNLITRKPVVCGMEQEEIFYPFFLKSDVRESALFSGSPSIQTVRTDFSDLMLWSLVTTDAEGNSIVSVEAPDTITAWNASSICISYTAGFGMTTVPAQYVTFLPFFVDFTMAQTIIKGEIMELRVSVPNYLEKCIKILVTLKESTEFDAVLTSGELESCICAKKKAYYKWDMTAKVLGDIIITISAETTHIGDTCDGPNDDSQPSRKDTVKPTFRVQPEGISTELTVSNFICVKDSDVEKEISVTLQEEAVEGSLKVFTTVMGDIISLRLGKPQPFRYIPYSCAEQNIALMSVLINELEYLKATNQLTPELERDIIRGITERYIRAVGFYVGIGSYSVFPGLEANGWVTIKTFSTFQRAMPYAYIDINIQLQTLIWIERLQDLTSGCLKRTGYLFRSQGDKVDDIDFTILGGIALLTSNYSLAISLTQGINTCVLEVNKSEQSTYTLAIIFYYLSLTKNWAEWSNALNLLLPKAVFKDGKRYWEHNNYPDVETTAYIFKALVNGPSIDETSMDYLAPIASWIVTRMNSYGAFTSTQDTDVAISAITDYARLINTPNGETNVTLTTQNGEMFDFIMTKSNRIVVQRQDLPNMPGNYTINVSGNGCCLIQTTCQYNVPVSPANAAFALDVRSSSENCLNGVAYTIDIAINISYTGSQEDTGMVIAEVKIMSGFSYVYGSLKQLLPQVENSNIISKTEVENGFLIFYLQPFSRETVSFTFRLQMGNRVTNIQDASVYVYKYYEISENAAAKYSHPCKAP